MEKKQDEENILNTDPEEVKNGSPDVEEPEWFYDEEPEEAEEDVSTDEEPEWFDEEEPEEEKEDESGDEEPEWFDEEEPEEDISEDEESEWFDEEDSEMPEDRMEEDPFDREEENLAGIVSESLKEEHQTGEETAPDFIEEEDFDKEDFGESAFAGENQAEEDESGGKKKHRKLKIGLIIAAAAVAGAYFGLAGFFWYHFQPNTIVNGIECDYMTVDELKDIISSEVHQYEIEIVERNDVVETLYGADFDLHAVYDDTLTDILHGQGIFKWPAAFFREASSYDPGRAVEWNEEEFKEALNSLECMDKKKMIDPKDAEVVFSDEEEDFVIVPADYGTHIEEDVFYEVMTNAVSALQDSVDLDAENCYQAPNVTEESQTMINACAQMNRMIAADITYDMLDIENVHISKQEMSDWIELSDNLEVTYNDEAIAAFVADFAEKYNTVDTEHTLETTWGPTVSVLSGSYGWRLDQEGEISQIKSDLAAGTTVVREPVWGNRAVSHGAIDYGNTYVEINLTAQHLYFYKNGSLIIDSDFVSGRMTQGRETPTGIYYVYYKQTNAVLKGEDYETPVAYWMPFNGGVGLHDATWRSSFGGTIYVSNGSHGCINLPYSVAQTIYENIDVGDCVFVYQLEGTEATADAATT